MQSERQSSNDDPDTREVRHRSKRPRRESPERASVHVDRAQAYGDSRMLTGTVNGPVVHGNYIAHASMPSVDRESTYNTTQQAAPQDASDVLSTKEIRELIDLLRFDQLDARLTTVKREQPKTCRWLLKRKDYRRWIKSETLDGADGFFWIRGNPGTGKSIAMKFLFRNLESKFRKQQGKKVISFFFNARGDSLEKSTLGLYRSLLYSLFSLDSSLGKAFDKCYKRTAWLRILRQSGWEASDEQLLKELLERVVTSLGKKKIQLYCFVDALDECPLREVSSMITYFENLASRVDHGNFRICFSSRHYPQIPIRTKLTCTLEKEACHYHDIETYVESQLHLGNEVDDEELAKIRAEIFEKSCGIFLWVNLVVYRLNQVYHQDGRIGAIRQALRAIPKADKETPTENGERALHWLFRDMIQKDDENIDGLVRLCQLVYCAKRPLSPQELHVALRGTYEELFDASEFTDAYLRREILRYSKGLAEVTVTERPTVQFIHETVRDFLRDGGLNALVSPMAHHSIQSAGHELFKEICLQQILVPVENELEFIKRYRERGRKPNQGIINFRSPAAKLKMEEQADFERQAGDRFPFLQYAVTAIFLHANRSRSSGNAQETFLQRFPVESWILLFNLFLNAQWDRFSGTETGMLYVLAWHGCTHLIQEPSVPRLDYGKTTKKDEYTTPLACAIFQGHFGTAEALVGMEAGSLRPERQLQRYDYKRGDTLLVTLLKIHDWRLLDRVLQDGACDSDPSLGLHELISIASPKFSDRMFDVLVKHGKIEGFELPRLPFDPIAHQTPSDENPMPYTDRALRANAALLTKSFTQGVQWLRFIRMWYPRVGDLFLKHAGAKKGALNIYLHVAARDGELEMVQDAVRRGADVLSTDERGSTVLHVVADLHTSNLTMIVYLLGLEPSMISVADTSGLTALQRSGYKFPDEVKMVFLERGADPNTLLSTPGFRGTIHHVPLASVCVMRNDRCTLKILVSDQCCDLNAPDAFGRTPLSYCFEYSPISIGACRVLMTAKDINFNARDANGYTILEHLIRNLPTFDTCDEELEKFLDMFCGAPGLDPNLKTSSGLAPLELIILRHDKENYREFYGGSEGQERILRQLVLVAKSLLRSGRVDRLVQQQCLALEEAPSAIREAIEESLSRLDIQD